MRQNNYIWSCMKCTETLGGNLIASTVVIAVSNFGTPTQEPIQFKGVTKDDNYFKLHTTVYVAATGLHV